MTRDLRLKTSGIIFYIVFILNLGLTNTGIEFFKKMFSTGSNFYIYQAAAALIGAGAVFFTSEAVGYLFSTLYSFWWNIILGKCRWGKGGYSREWQKLGYNIKNILVNSYKEEIKTHKTNEHGKFEKQLRSYSDDVFLSYFWQQAPIGIVDWTIRRLNLFFTGMTTLIGLFLGFILSILAVWQWNMGWTKAHVYLGVVIFIFGVMIYWTSRYCRYEVWQMIDLWFSEKMNPEMQNAMKRIMNRANKALQPTPQSGAAELGVRHIKKRGNEE